MANDIDPCKGIITLENSKFAENTNGKVVVRVEDEVGTQEIVDAINNISGGGGNQSVVSQNELAGQTISAVRAVQLDGVTQKLIYATNDNTVAEAQTLGLSRQGGSLDDSINVVTFGPYADSSITFAVNDCVYLDMNGLLTNVAPVSGIFLQIGKVIKENTIFVDIEQPIVL